jgi:hypothetical protein
MCLPFDTGVDLLPRVSVEQAYLLMNEYKEETRPALVETFIEAYPALIEAAKLKTQALASELGIEFVLLWNSSDYPAVPDVQKKFSFDWDFLSLTVPDALKMAGKFEEESAKLEAKIQNVSEEITAVMRESLLELVEHLKSSLETNADGKPKRLFNTAVTNIQDFLDSFKARNITNDTQLDAISEELKKIIHPNVNADMLKKDEQFKGTVHDSMAEISAKLAALVEVTPGRKFRAASGVSSPAPIPDASTE